MSRHIPACLFLPALVLVLLCSACAPHSGTPTLPYSDTPSFGNVPESTATSPHPTPLPPVQGTARSSSHPAQPTPDLWG